MISKPEKYLLLEFKSKTTLSQSFVMTAATAIVDHISAAYTVSLYTRQVIFNNSNIIEMYCALRRSPALKKKVVTKQPVSTAYTSDSDYASAPPPATPGVTLPSLSKTESWTGEIKKSTFNGQEVLIHTLRTSSGQQTDSDPQFPPIEPLSPKPTSETSESETADPAQIYAKIESSYAHSKILSAAVFPKVRRFLAYYQPDPTNSLHGESYLDLKIRITADGITDNDELLRQQYTEALISKGFKPHEIKKDLETLANYMHTSRVKHVSSAQQAFEQYYGTRVRKQVTPPINSPGRCDPELCVIV